MKNIHTYIQPEQPGGPDVIWFEDDASTMPYRRRIDRVPGAPLEFYEDLTRRILRAMLRRRQTQ